MRPPSCSANEQRPWRELDGRGVVGVARGLGASGVVDGEPRRSAQQRAPTASSKSLRGRESRRPSLVPVKLATGRPGDSSTSWADAEAQVPLRRARSSPSLVGKRARSPDCPALHEGHSDRSPFQRRSLPSVERSGSRPIDPQRDLDPDARGLTALHERHDGQTQGRA